MKIRDIAALRLRTQRVCGLPFDSPGNVVHWLGAMQSQEFGVAKWSIGKRMRAATEAAIDKAFDEGIILRTHVLRPTWHFVLPADIRWILELTGPRVHKLNAPMYRKLELDDRLRTRARTLFERALAGNVHLTRRDLQAVLHENGIDASGQRLAYIMMRAELNGVLCSGALKGKQHTYALIDERAPRSRSLPRDEALAELARRYVTSHGPATVKDFAWWSGLTLADVRRGIEIAAPRLETFSVDGRSYWSAGPAPASHHETAPTAHLMQGYDEYIVAYSESRDVLIPDGITGSPRFRPPFTHALIIDGMLAGHWRRLPRANTLALEVQLLRALNRRDMAALDAAADRYRQFAGAQHVDLRFLV
ncbi:MAG: winged helix DNA-binding domain-containing protein [Longimicrobiales bacterium]